MKAKIRETGEIVDIIDYNVNTSSRSISDFVSYTDSKGIVHSTSLNYYWDFEPIEQFNSDEHWQDIRGYAAIAAMQAMLSCGEGAFSYDGRKDDIAKAAVEYANALVEELKKE